VFSVLGLWGDGLAFAAILCAHSPSATIRVREMEKGQQKLLALAK
jgi:hypothetical protein